jgi:hypothetical protein
MLLFKIKVLKHINNDIMFIPIITIITNRYKQYRTQKKFSLCTVCLKTIILILTVHDIDNCR